jgi:tellurite resistance protein TerA
MTINLAKGDKPVTMEIDNGIPDQVVAVSAANANADNRVYTCAVGIVENTPDGILVHALEDYSRPGSEQRPTVELTGKGWSGRKNPVVQVHMDAGPVNAYK